MHCDEISKPCEYPDSAGSRKRLSSRRIRHEHTLLSNSFFSFQQFAETPSTDLCATASLTNFRTNGVACKFGFNCFKWPIQKNVPPSLLSRIEEVHASIVGHSWIAQHLECVPEFVTN
jgi:hypothetical protein